MLVDDATAARAVPAAVQQLAWVLPDGRSRAEAGLIAVATGLPVPTLNGVFALGSAVTADLLAVALGEVVPRGVPFCLQARPAARAAAEQAARAHEMFLSPAEIPLMVLDGPLAAAGADGLVIRPLGIEDSSLHGRLAARAFDIPAEIFDRVVAPALTLPGTRLYVGEIDGEPVTTALAVAGGDALGVFNVATPPEHRRRGYGAAITGRLLNDGLTAGMRWAWLQSTPEGAGVYARLGFRQVETWACWLSPTGDS